MAVSQVLEIPQDVFDSARLTLAELKIEMALHLSAECRLSIGKARELAALTLWGFRQLLGSRRISPVCDATNPDQDVTMLRELGALRNRGRQRVCADQSRRHRALRPPSGVLPRAPNS